MSIVYSYDTISGDIELLKREGSDFWRQGGSYEKTVEVLKRL